MNKRTNLIPRDSAESAKFYDDKLKDPMELFGAINFITDYKHSNPAANKDIIQRGYVNQYAPRRARSIFVGNGYALRFSEANTSSFSNTVSSLSALRHYDDHPFVVVVVRKRVVQFLLANTTFLKKISHSSQRLRVDCIRGSFNGTDVMTEYESLKNAPENFHILFEQHLGFTWQENVSRLVEATNAIVGRNVRFTPNHEQRQILMEASERAARALKSREFHEIEAKLQERVRNRRGDIIEAARIDNVNLRGNAIEKLITDGDNTHEFADLVYSFGKGELFIDIKTKLLNRGSSPKAYNVDKMLDCLATPGSVFAFFVVGVNTGTDEVFVRLLPVLESALLDATQVQHHWAGRSSRGVTQLTGKFNHALNTGYRPNVDAAKARDFLESLLSR